MVDEPPIGPDPAEPKIYGLFDANGTPKGYWNDVIFPSNPDGSRNDKIPPEAVVITSEHHQELLSNQTARYIDGEVTYPLSAKPLGSAEYDWGEPLVTVVGRPQ